MIIENSLADRASIRQIRRSRCDQSAGPTGSSFHTWPAFVRGLDRTISPYRASTGGLPFDADLLATASCPPPDTLSEFLDTIQRKRRARLSLDSQVHCKKVLSATHTGLFVPLIY